MHYLAFENDCECPFKKKKKTTNDCECCFVEFENASAVFVCSNTNYNH